MIEESTIPDTAIKIIENTWIPLSDGTRLAAKIWMPDDAEVNPVPAILEYIPYRKRDRKALRDSQIHGYFARHGYAGVRVDLRGSGDSEGILRDEYLQQEHEDGLEVLRWLSEQSWCDGKVALFGLSWGGFNGLQIAALRPPQLGAVISVCASDDRYSDDVHYMGGCLLTDNLSWASTMFGFNSCPPDPMIVGEKWRNMWLDRLQGSELWIKKWLEHPHRKDYWKHGSVCENYDAIEVPVMAVSGWADGYTNAVMRLLENLKTPRKGLIGPWGHKYPHMGGPGPGVDFLGECIRWFDCWLKGRNNGVPEEPMLRTWMHDSATPLTPQCSGRWVAEPQWPPPNGFDQQVFYFGNRVLFNEDEADRVEDKDLSVQSPLSCGLFAGKWCSYAEGTDLPWDQREDDGGARTFDTDPLEEDIEILGAPLVELEVSADKPVAMLAVRLSDVARNDYSTRVTFGVLNLTHRNSHESPEPLEPGKRYKVVVRLNDVAQRFPAGNRMRVSVSSSYWPLAWPAPESARVTLYIRGCRLVLPVRDKRPEDAGLRPFGPARVAPALPHTLLEPPKREWNVNHNLATNEVQLNVVNNDALIRLDEAELTEGRYVREAFRFQSNLYDTVRGETTHTRTFQRGDWKVRTITNTVLSSTRTHFLIRATLDAYEGDVRVFSKSWDESVPRQLV
ncbi:MAG: CocE/NonD family hydrolase [Opitutales bacterium]